MAAKDLISTTAQGWRQTRTLRALHVAGVLRGFGDLAAVGCAAAGDGTAAVPTGSGCHFYHKLGTMHPCSNSCSPTAR